MTATASKSGDGSAFRAPSAWIPLILAATALALLAGYLLTGPHEPNIVIENGLARQDETAAARIWQLLMLAQLPFMLWFAAAWLPKDPARATKVVAIQALAFIAAALPVILLEG
jgi:hypothetical protein